MSMISCGIAEICLLSGLSKNVERNFSDKSSSKSTHEAYFLNLTIKYEYKIVIRTCALEQGIPGSPWPFLSFKIK